MPLQVINEINKDPSLIADLRDTGKQRSRGVIQLNKPNELGKVDLPTTRYQCYR